MRVVGGCSARGSSTQVHAPLSSESEGICLAVQGINGLKALNQADQADGNVRYRVHVFTIRACEVVSQ